MSELETKIRNVIKAWRNVTRSVDPSEDEAAMVDALLDLEGHIKKQSRPDLNTELEEYCDECGAMMNQTPLLWCPICSKDLFGEEPPVCEIKQPKGEQR
jgi:rubrerythrin